LTENASNRRITGWLSAWIHEASQPMKPAAAGHWVGWVGRFDDFLSGREGDNRVRLDGNRHAWDCACPGVEGQPDGTEVTTTPGHWDEVQPPWVTCRRFTLAELDARAKR
jgi:hypothetical protein